MGENSKIGWTDHTFNPWIGCVKVSEGCANCYAERDFDKRYGIAQWGQNTVRVKTSLASWRKVVEFNRRAEREKKTEFVFCASLADVFESREHPMSDKSGAMNCISQARAELFNLIDATPRLTWLLLTKRPQNIRECWIGGHRSNVILGTSTEDQETFDLRFPILSQCADLCNGLFVSAEPLLGPIVIPDSVFLNGGLSWVIAGGESGPKGRIIEADWIRSLLLQCRSNDCPFFFKQWGANRQEHRNPPRSNELDGETIEERPNR